MAIDVLQAKIRKTKNPTMVGLDPTPELIPPSLLELGCAERGHNPAGLARAYTLFCQGILDALKGFVPAVKVQAACFFALGHDGAAALEEVLPEVVKKHLNKIKNYCIIVFVMSW